MTVQLAAQYYDITVTSYAEGEVITTSNLADIIELHNLQYAVGGCRVGGIAFDPIFTTTSATYTVTNATSGGRDADTWTGQMRLRRPGQSSGTVGHFIAVTATLSNATLGVDVYYGELLLGTIEVTASGGWERVTASVFVTEAAGTPLLLRPRGLKVVAAGTARCATFVAHDTVLAASTLPRGY